MQQATEPMAELVFWMAAGVFCAVVVVGLWFLVVRPAWMAIEQDD